MKTVGQKDISYLHSLDELISENRARFLMKHHWIKYSAGPFLIEAIYNEGQGYFFYSEDNGLTFQPVYEVVIEPGWGGELEGVSGGFQYVADWAQENLKRE